MKYVILMFLFFVTCISAQQLPGSVNLDYKFMKINFSCVHRGYNYVHYVTVPDTGFIARYEPFYKDRNLDQLNCPGQFTADSYKSPAGTPAYHRGHGVPQNLWDHNIEYMKITNRMSNVVPQHGVQNTNGLWRALEMRIECVRDSETVYVWAGNVWGNDAKNDYFIKSHGVTTPDYLWVAHHYTSNKGKVFIWLIPNNDIARSTDDEKYRVTKLQLANQLDYPLPYEIANLDDTGVSSPFKVLNCSQQ